MITIADAQQHDELLETHRLDQYWSRIRRHKSAQIRRDAMRNRPGLVRVYNKDADLRNFGSWGEDEKTRIAEDYTPPSRLQNLREANQSFAYDASLRVAQDSLHSRLSSAGF